MKVLKKLKNINQLIKEIDMERINGATIVYCHGVFDLLHIGHIKYFQEAKSLGDVLVVTITPDRFVNKGPDRPAFGEDIRTEAVASLDVVDYVAINEFPTAVETIRYLKPDYYVKGPDYKEHSRDISGNIQLEEKAVRSVGGEMVYTSDITFSASSLINQHFSNYSGEQREFLDSLKKNYSVEQIIQYIERFQELDVLLVGEAIIDEYVFCDTIGKSGKEPVLVNQKIRSEKYSGGICAVANHVSNFCNHADIITYLGEVESEKDFITKSLNPNCELFTVIKSKSPTIKKTRFVDNYTGTKTLGVYDLNDDLLNSTEEAEIMTKFEAIFAKNDVVISADYGHGLITSRIVEYMEDKSSFLAVNTQLNASNIGYHSISKYHSADYICIHEGELRHDYRNRTDSVENLVKDLSAKIKTYIIVITCGKAGSLAYMNNNFYYCPAYATKIVDRVGAGDTLLAITSLCFAAGVPADLTLFIGNLAAAQMVATTGTGMKLNKVNLIKYIESILK
tara:strand:- start:1114 stop:2637 length:1524 start_codon:yes stop_codon:yes gene_type:complete